jgi:hypothetical protein
LNTKAQIIVMPRLGTISPWSSKASDILHLCGLEKIKRIERGIIYHFDRSVTDKKAVLSVIKPDRNLAGFLRLWFHLALVDPHNAQNVQILRRLTPHSV